MSEQFTAGPWTVEHRTGTRERYVILAGADRSIMICSGKNYDEEDAANACLIAAAPDLLAFVQMMAGSTYTQARAFAPETVDAARALLVRVNGEEVPHV